MSASARPRLSVGLPVYNGEDFVHLAIESTLGQTFGDLELVIADNASTDGTRDICESYARRDKRVRYHRNETNIGATQNWYLVHKLSTADYFASMAHDDVYEPEYMRKCIEVLDADPSVAVCHSKTCIIDGQGQRTGVMDVEIDTTSPFAHDRLYQIIRNDYLCIQLYGVMRSAALGATKVFQGYYGCDRNTLAELALIGKIAEVPEHLFLHRLYPGALGWIVNSGKSTQEMARVDPGTNWNERATGWRIFRSYLESVARLVDSPAERARCYAVLARLGASQMSHRAWRALRSRLS